jgi:hypothetical protein
VAGCFPDHIISVGERRHVYWTRYVKNDEKPGTRRRGSIDWRSLRQAGSDTSAILARTERIRVGFSVLLLPLHHPIRLAEEIATLDVLSNGCVDFGISRGGNKRYLRAYGLPEDYLDGRFHSCLESILRAWCDKPVDFGETTQSVKPKPAGETAGATMKDQPFANDGGAGIQTAGAFFRSLLEGTF